MADIDKEFDGFTIKQLRELKDRIDAKIIVKQKTERADLKAKFAELAAESGLSLDDILGSKRGGKGSVAPKYRNPDNADETWSGRGRMPIWLAERLKKRGVSKDDFAI